VFFNDADCQIGSEVGEKIVPRIIPERIANRGRKATSNFIITESSSTAKARIYAEEFAE